MSEERPPLGGFLGGTLVTQVANSALHLAQPLLIAELSGSLGKAALFTALETAVHMAGTAAAGWPADKLGPRRLLILATFARGAALAAVPAAWALGRLTTGVAVCAYTLDALIRGSVDTAVHALPLTLTEGERGQLDALNSRYELAFDLGGVAGPVGLGILFGKRLGMLANALIPLGFAAAALVYMAVPRERRAPAPEPRGGAWRGLRLALADPRLLVGCLGLALLNLYPLRKLLSAFFAKAILRDKSAVAWVGGAFGLGGMLGSAAYAARGSRVPPAAWLVGGAAGTAALAVGWLPGTLWPMAAAAFAFGALNVGARLAVTRQVQEATPVEAAGGVTAVARAASNGASVLLKALVGAAFALGAGARTGFEVVGAGLLVIAAGQLALALRTAREDGREPLAAEETSVMAGIDGVGHYR